MEIKPALPQTAALSLQPTTALSKSDKESLTSSLQLIASLAQAQTGELSSAMELSRYCSNLTPVAAMSPVTAPLSLLRREHETDYLKAIALLVMRAMELVNATNTLSTTQIADLTMRIGKTYFYLRLPEILLCFQRAADGAYGTDYNRIDAAKVMGWLEQYDVNERTPAAERLRLEADDARRKEADTVEGETPADEVTEADMRAYLERAKAEGHNVPEFNELTDEQRTQLMKYVPVRKLYDRVAAGEKTYTGDQLRMSQRRMGTDGNYEQYRNGYLAANPNPSLQPETDAP